MFRNFKVILTVLVVLVLAGGAYAFANSNGTLPATEAGYSGSVVAGYEVTDVKYNLNEEANLVETIQFKLTGTLDAVKVYVQTADTGWKDCSTGIGEATSHVQLVTCTYTTPFLPLAEITKLNIVASSTDSTTP
jgi:hypothetical protein